MNSYKEIFDEISIKFPDFINTTDLVKIGLFSSDGQAGALRARGGGPPFTRSWNGYIMYPKGPLLQWIKEEMPSSFGSRARDKGDDSFQPPRSLSITVSQRLLIVLIAESQKEDEFITTNKWVANFLEKHFAPLLTEEKPNSPLARPTQQEEFPLAPSKPKKTTPRKARGKFLSIKMFIKAFPSFSDSFFRKQLAEVPEFRKKVLIKVQGRYLVNVEEFWKFLEEVNQRSPHEGEKEDGK